MIRATCAAALLATLYGCATSSGGGVAAAPAGMQTLTLAVVNAGGMPIDANCTLSNDKGSWTAAAPGAATVAGSAQQLSVVCRVPGLFDGTVTAIPRRAADHGLRIPGGDVHRYPDTLQIMMGRGLTLDLLEQYSAQRAKCLKEKTC